MTTLKCTYCDNQFERRKADVNKMHRNGSLPFCSKYCWSKHVNKDRIGKRKQNSCIICSNPTSKRRKYCDSCNPKSRKDWSSVTLEELSGRYSYQKHGRVRSLARSIYASSNKPKKCVNCGYDKFYEVAHIKAISEFPTNTPISVINDISNLAALCPNCHWEFDRGLLRLEVDNEVYQKEKIEYITKSNTCEICNTAIVYKSTFCIPCSIQKRKKVSDRPSREELEELIRTTPFIHIAAQYGVSDNAVRKWCKYYGLPFRKKDIEEYFNQLTT